jgi:photosystem II stability/assembly factor-like uncharacterized protein
MKSIGAILTVFLSFFLTASFAQDDEIILSGKELFGNMQARQIGPALMSGRVSDIEGHPTNKKVIFIGSAGGGVWKSANGGVSFKPIFDEYCQSIGNVALDPNNPDKVVWVGTGEVWTRNSVSVGDGIYKSTDGGVTWEKKGLEQSDRISSIEINPNNSDEVYVGVLGALWGDSDERGVYKTSDGGETWEKIFGIDEKTGCADLVMDPKDPNTLYASMWEFRRTAWSFNSGGENSALYKSTDGGKTWNKIHNGFPDGKLGRIAITVAPSDNNILYAVIESEKDEEKGLYRSDDGGMTWNHLNKDFGLVVRPFYFSRIVVDPKDPDVVVKAGLFGSISRDGGKTFKDLGNMHPDIHDIWFDIEDSDRMFVATDGGLYRSYDGGSTLEIVANLPLSQFYHISVDDAEPYRVFGGLQDNGSWYGPSSSPGGIEAKDWTVIGFGDGFRVLKHPTKELVYTEMQGAENVWRYDLEKNRTKTIQPLAVEGDPKLRFNWNAPLAVSKHNPDRIYVGSQFLHRSDDMGATWEKISPDLTTDDKTKQQQEESGGLSKDNSGAENHCTIFTIAESTLDENVIWVGTDDGNVQVTQDGGKTWSNTIENVKGLPANTWCYHIEASVHDKGTAYAVFDGHTRNDKNTYVYKTSDFGQSWESIATDDIYGFARSIQEDFVNPDLLFLGTEFGLYITINGGKNWSKFTNNVPAVAIHHLELQENTSDLVMGTHGRGVIILDDISPLRELNQEVLAKDVHFFKSEPTVIKEEAGFGFGGGSTEQEYVGPNPPAAATIAYYLKKRHTFGKMSMEVQDMEGNKIFELSPGKSKGINVVTWNYRTRQPKMAKAKTLSFGGFTSPRVPPGKYKIVLNKGKQSYETEIELIPDPNSLLSEEDREELHNITMKLYNLTEDLAYLVSKIDESIAFAKASVEMDAAASKVADPVIKEMNALKETLVITEGDNYVGTSEPQLREKLAKLYSKVAQGFDKPGASELENMRFLEGEYQDAVRRFDELSKKYTGKLNKYRAKKGESEIEFKSREEYLETAT